MDSVQGRNHRHHDQLTAPRGEQWRLEGEVVADRSPITVVIVDDQVMVAESFAMVLAADDDMTVVAVAASAASGLDEVERHQPDVLLLEQRLPDGLGTDHLAAMVALCPALKVLVVTGDHSDDLVARSIGAGAVGVIHKTGRVATLVDAVRAAARGEAVVSPDDLRHLLPHTRSSWTKIGDDLTAREREVLTLLAAGTSTSNVAAVLFVAPATARNHIQAIMTKLGAHSRLEAVSVALRENILQAA